MTKAAPYLPNLRFGRQVRMIVCIIHKKYETRAGRVVYLGILT